ncbi:uncharacterized protein LOC136037922 isoform X1 [Artemia franciscana]|uniref:uncharacterized protein LOC136037922 isoform X1 n=1 Tax=Artemia franciscana TaxID=6661 RepID=UPI0032DA64FA
MILNFDGLRYFSALFVWTAIIKGVMSKRTDIDFEDNVAESSEIYESHSLPEFPKEGPRFLQNQVSNVTVITGKNAKLICNIMDLGNWTVSWIRHRDTHLVSVGLFVYTADMRFRPMFKQYYNDDSKNKNGYSYIEWTLEILSPQQRDDGVYECQINTTPFRSHFVNFRVIDPITRILGLPEVFVDKGSTINLTCTITQAPEPPNYIRWSLNSKAISYDSPRGGVSVVVEKGIYSSSSLIIQNARMSDSGNYTCKPDNAAPASVLVHVLNEFPAAMQHGGSLKKHFGELAVVLCLLNYFLL